jgi:hypothetical protein
MQPASAINPKSNANPRMMHPVPPGGAASIILIANLSQ